VKAVATLFLNGTSLKGSFSVIVVVVCFYVSCKQK